MTFLAPLFLLGAAVAGALVVLFHFIVSQQARTALLPTARFAPELSLRDRSRLLKLDDLWLLALRLLLIAACGAALARPVLHPLKQSLLRIVLADRSRAVASASEVADSTRHFLRAQDQLILFDSSAAPVAGDADAALTSLAPSPARGRLTPALIAALRSASLLRDAADSVELAIVSPLATEEFDAATDSVRVLWPGAARLVPVAARRAAQRSPALVIIGARDDVLRLVLSESRVSPDVWVVRGAPSAADTAWAQSGRAVVLWPADGRPYGWAVRRDADTVGALIAGEVTVVAPFIRRTAFAGVHGAFQAVGANRRVIARWVDGMPAAFEEPLGRGCLRTVAVAVPARGDLVISPRFRRFAEAMTRPCAYMPPAVRADPSALGRLRGDGTRPVAARAFARAEAVASPLAPWLLAAALALALAELRVRSRHRAVAHS